MEGIYPIIAFGIILFYMSVVWVVFIYAVMIRLVPVKVRIPAVNASFHKIRAWLR